MTFDRPNAVAAMNQAVAAVSDKGDCWDVIGKPLDRPVDETLPAYDEKLTLDLDPSGGDKRLEISGLNWGKIEKDAARLHGLAAAVENISAVVRSGKDRLAHDWKGESFDAFRAAIEKLEKTLDDYSAAVRTTADGLATAMENVRTLYTAYRDRCAGTVLDFSGFVPPQDWFKIGEPEVQFLKWCAHCVAACDKEEMVRGILVGQALQRANYQWFHDWDGRNHEQDARTALNFSNEERGKLSRKINEFYAATDALKEPVGQAFDAALENLRILAEAKVFSSLQVPGAGATGGDPGPGGYPGSGGGAPGGGAVMPPPLPDPAPEPAPVEAAVPEPPAPESPATTPAATAGADAGSMTIKDGDRTISVTSPDGAGHVKVTVEGADGKAKSYDLDFDAASGLPPEPDARPAGSQAPQAEHVPAGTNGQCVIRDGSVTITAERPLFEPGTIKLEVDDGVNEPTTYTLDFDDTDDAAQPDEASGTVSDPADPRDGARSSADADARPAARTGDQPAEGTAAGERSAAQPADAARAGDRPAVAPADGARPGAAGGDPVAAPAGGPADARPDAVEGEPVAGQVAGGESAAGEQEQITTPQGVPADGPGSLSGVLVPDQSTGEAELASAGEDEPAGMAGDAGAGGMPMMAGAGTAEAGRAGTGWSVHGDLFDNHDPVYSMHGVLGEDDLEGR